MAVYGGAKTQGRAKRTTQNHPYRLGETLTSRLRKQQGLFEIPEYNAILVIPDWDNPTERAFVRMREELFETNRAKLKRLKTEARAILYTLWLVPKVNRSAHSPTIRPESFDTSALEPEDTIQVHRAMKYRIDDSKHRGKVPKNAVHKAKLDGSALALQVVGISPLVGNNRACRLILLSQEVGYRVA